MAKMLTTEEIGLVKLVPLLQLYTNMACTDASDRGSLLLMPSVSLSNHVYTGLSAI